jgi:hypothetical protein
MSRVVAIIDEFLKSLQKPLPELESVCKDVSLRFANEDIRESVIRETVETLGKYDEKIVQRDDSVILSGIEILPGLKLSDYWTELSVRTQDAIWKYINLILLAGAKYVRALDRKNVRNERTGVLSKGDDKGDKDVSIAISEKLKDPEMREKMMETIRKTLETIPDTNEAGDDTNEVIGEFMNQLNGTNIGSLIQDIVSDLSGEISPESLGLPEGSDLESLGGEDLMGLISNPMVATKLFGLVSKISDKITGKLKSGNINQDDLVRESQELLAKSGGLLNKMNPQVAQMMKSMGLNPDDLAKMSSRKVRRAVEKKAKSSKKGKGKGKIIRKKKGGKKKPDE